MERSAVNAIARLKADVNKNLVESGLASGEPLDLKTTPN